MVFEKSLHLGSALISANFIGPSDACNATSSRATTSDMFLHVLDDAVCDVWDARLGLQLGDASAQLVAEFLQ
eukprot:7203129-Pyramimonas_sp.AAC.2